MAWWSSSEDDDASAFLQKRIAVFSATSFILWLVVAIASQGAAAAWKPPGIAVDFSTMMLTHIIVTVVLGLVWFYTAYRKCSKQMLDMLDIGSPIFQSTITAFIMLQTLPMFRADLSMIMGFSFIAIGRAAIVPSSARRTILITFIGSLPIEVATYVTYSLAIGNGKVVPLPPHVAAVQCATWALLGTLLAGVISRVIYGLRQRVQESARMGQYILEKKIGEGGMGAVFRARHVLLRRPTAVKVLSADRAGDVSLARFEREVQLTSEISHPNVVSVYDYGRSSDGGFYYAMEYLDGFDLQRLVDADGPQPASRVVYILAQVAEALAEAHGVGLIHRDVKPANILLCRHPRRPDHVKVVDFGLVKKTEASQNSDANLSVANAIMGTPLYLAPEAITSPESVDARSDLYALGAVGYFLLTGKPLFSGAGVLDVLTRTLSDKIEPPSQKLGAPVPAKLEAIIMKCLARDPKLRPTDAATFRDELLACNGDDVGLWTMNDAKEWWKARAEDVANRARVKASEDEVSPFDATLTIAPRSAARDAIVAVKRAG
jgi:eukaryotic-like serine/threonine-protein kinase